MTCMSISGYFLLDASLCTVCIFFLLQKCVLYDTFKTYLFILPIPPRCKIYFLFRRIQSISFYLFFKGQLKLESFTRHPGPCVLLLGNSTGQGLCSAYISHRMGPRYNFPFLLAMPWVAHEHFCLGMNGTLEKLQSSSLFSTDNYCMA